MLIKILCGLMLFLCLTPAILVGVLDSWRSGIIMLVFIIIISVPFGLLGAKALLGIALNRRF